MVKIKFVIERDELDGWYSYHMVIGKKAVTFIPMYDRGTCQKETVVVGYRKTGYCSCRNLYD